MEGNVNISAVDLTKMEETGVTGGEHESSNGSACHHRKGESPSVCCLVRPPSCCLFLFLTSTDSWSSGSSVPNQSRLVSAVYWLCGMEREKDENVGALPPEPTVCSLEEKPCLKLIVNINLIVCLCVTVFIYGFWA